MGIRENDQCHTAHTYACFGAVPTHGKGCRVYDENEKEYLDLTADIGVNALGYAGGAWVQAATNQTATLPHVPNLYYSQPDSDVAGLLCERYGFISMFFTSSEAEADGDTIKVVRKYSSGYYGSERYETIALVSSFHGRTTTALSTTGQDHFHQYFGPFILGLVHAVANDIVDLKSKVSKRTCAVMSEMIQGEGGVLPLEPTFVSVVAELRREQDVLLITDEAQTGIGRCGTLHAYEQYGIHPDIVTTVKGLGDGLPIGGVLLSEKISDAFHPGDHDTTFGGDPIACVGAHVVLERMDEAFLSVIQKKGTYVEQRLSEMPYVVQVNGLGLVRGVILDGATARDVMATCTKKGVSLLAAKDKLRLLPLLTITLDKLKEAMDVMETILTQIA